MTSREVGVAVFRKTLVVDMASREIPATLVEDMTSKEEDLTII
jgi:hypothetical protein